MESRFGPVLEQNLHIYGTGGFGSEPTSFGHTRPERKSKKKETNKTQKGMNIEIIAHKIIDDFILSHDKALKTGRGGGEGETKGDDKAKEGTEKEEEIPLMAAMPGTSPGSRGSSSKGLADEDTAGDRGMEELIGGLPDSGRTTRRKILPHEIGAVKKGQEIEGIYIGRPSAWGNPYRIQGRKQRRSHPEVHEVP